MTLERAVERAGRRLAMRSSRRSFLARLGKAVVAVAGGSFVAVAMDPQRVEAFHICGHIWTTGSCPHPYHPHSRIDQYGYPVHPDLGHPVDDSGDTYLSRNQTRRRVCEQVVAERYPYTKPTALQGTWSRCCNGRVRRIVDCCSHSSTRINGDASLTGYCWGGRKVFCITYRDTNVRC